jgi:glycosyltransferase involved in cell wall biosynthesis
VIEAFKQVCTSHKLLIIGGAPYAQAYIKELHERARSDQRIAFTGFVFGDDYRALQQNAYCYVHATEVGGTHPALLEAMGYGNCVLTLQTPENIETLNGTGLTYTDANDLSVKLQQVIKDHAIVDAYRRHAQTRVRNFYNWERIVDRYENLFAKLADLPQPWPDEHDLKYLESNELLSRKISVSNLALK